ncbi:phospholipase D-like domain-containing protein [Rhizobium terrae]|uniref:phospholipase D-like domain-containing protein n=1 Tax=Rhizobium terrae TaxID=2171756 RepID=UPI000E3C8BC1|nr:phospholipase D-like domain-containing protein [Rhizobium terrae]
MRVAKDGISVKPIVGSHTVLFGFDATPEARKGLLGFTLGKRKAGTGDIRWMRGFKFFEETNPHPEPGESKSTREHPIQDFQWGDYAAEPATSYDYVVQAVYGKPSALTYGPEIELNDVKTANASDAVHGVYFNRGAIPSQAFADRFGNVGPTDQEQNDPGNEKVKWLSRGLLEAALAYIAQANGSRFELRVAAYEFHYMPILEALKIAAGTGAKVQICYDAGDRKQNGDIVLDETSEKNVATIAAAKLAETRNLTLHTRCNFSKIPHNKFIVLLKNDKPVQIWTGSTNFTSSGFLGQSNVAHVLRDPALAAVYNQYWEKLAGDPETRTFKAFNTRTFPDPVGELTPNAMKAVFAPREAGLLEWFAERMDAASSSVMFTAAFGVAEQLVAKFASDKDFIRFVLMERPDSNAEAQATLAVDRDTRIALGSRLNAETIALKLKGHALDEWFRKEEHFRARGNIFYIHTKIMLIDALSDDPQIYCGSANFSNPSVTGNDENMMLMRGPDFRSVADIYVNEYMRLFNHLYFRTVAIKLAKEKRGDPRKAAILEPDDGWARSYFKSGSYHDRMRNLFR